MKQLSLITGLLLFILLLGSSCKLGNKPQTNNTVDTLAYERYHNERFGFSIEYPSKLLIPQPEATNGDGRTFISEDGEFKMIAYGGHNMDFITQEPLDIKNLFQEVLIDLGEEELIKSQLKEDNQFIIISKSNGHYNYKYTCLTDEYQFHIVIEYPEEKDSYNLIAEYMISSFKPIDIQ